MITVLVLVGVWLTLARGVTPGQVVAGVVVGGVAMALVPNPRRSAVRLQHLPALLLHQSWKVLVATASVMSLVLSRGELPETASIEVTLPERNSRRLSLVAVLVTLTPGTYVTGVDPSQGRLRVHLLDARTEGATRAELADLHDRVRLLIPDKAGANRETPEAEMVEAGHE